MLKVSKLADYAVVVLGTLARSDTPLMTASGISLKSGLPEPTVAKILKLLAREGILQSERGVNGGYKMTGAPGEISIARIVEAVDGPISITACVDDAPGSCAYEGSCAVKGRWTGVNRAIRAAMTNVSLADMTGQCLPRESGDLKAPAFAGETEGVQ